MKNEYDENVAEWFPLKYGNIIVQLKDHDGVDDNGYSKKNKFTTMSIGVFHFIPVEKIDE